jgi:hypothetical protein
MLFLTAIFPKPYMSGFITEANNITSRKEITCMASLNLVNDTINNGE